MSTGLTPTAHTTLRREDRADYGTDTIHSILDEAPPAPGRRPHLRPMTDKEVQGTALIAIPIDEASAKVRTGPPVDDEDDHALAIWAGVVPVSLHYGDPVPDPLLHPDATAPAVAGFFHP